MPYSAAVDSARGTVAGTLQSISTSRWAITLSSCRLTYLSLGMTCEVPVFKDTHLFGRTTALKRSVSVLLEPNDDYPTIPHSDTVPVPLGEQRRLMQRRM